MQGYRMNMGRIECKNVQCSADHLRFLGVCSDATCGRLGTLRLIFLEQAGPSGPRGAVEPREAAEGAGASASDLLLRLGTFSESHDLLRVHTWKVRRGTFSDRCF